MYGKSAAYYDAIYDFKDYEQEAQIVHRLIEQHRRSAGHTLLDVACGTGRHMAYLQKFYTVMGLDLSPELLAVARQRCPEAKFYEADMVDFDLSFQVDAIVCLFSAIGYVKTVPRLQQTIRAMAHHLQRDGVLMVEPWFSPDTWHPGSVHANFVDEPDLKIARMTISEQHGRVSRNNFHFLVATPEGITTFTERHELGLFTHEEYMQAFHAGSLDVIHNPEGITGRGLYIGLHS